MRLRVLVTGSRDWPEAYADKIFDDLTALLSFPETKILTVVHGDCPTGADHWAKQWCIAWEPMAAYLGKDVIPEPHPAAWNVLGKAAGPVRNGEMVALGADLCLGYPLDLSRGTRDCMAKASRAGIPVWNRARDLGLDVLVPNGYGVTVTS